MKPRVTISLDATLLDRADAFANKIGISRSSLVDVALRQFMSPEGADKREAALARRLDRLTRQYGSVERDISILSETLALFIHQQLAIAPPIPVEDEEAIRAKGRERFEQFIAHLGRRLAGGGPFRTAVLETLRASETDFFALDLDPANDNDQS